MLGTVKMFGSNKEKKVIPNIGSHLITPPPSTEDYQLMKNLLEDAEKYFNRGHKEIEESLLRELENHIKKYCA